MSKLEDIKNVSASTWYTGPTLRGVDYSPTWPTWVVGTGGTQTGDSDFANDAFQSLWGNTYQQAPAGDTSAPVNNGTNYRDDLKTIRSTGFNMVRLYNWDMARGTTSTSGIGLDHINFLNYANTLGLKVVVPVSDYFLSDDQYAWNNQALANYKFGSATEAIQKDFTQFIASITDPTTGKIHSAIHSISVGNEGDIGQGLIGTGAGGTTTTPSNFLARTIWWILNLHQQINGSDKGPNGNPVVNGATPVIRLSATFSNADQGGTGWSWFQCLISGVPANHPTPNGCAIALGPKFATAVAGLNATDPSYTSYYYNSINISQVSTVQPFENSLKKTMALYDSGATPWPGAKFNVPLLLMELFTPNRTTFPNPKDQATAAISQVKSLETYLSENKAGTTQSTTNLMGYNYFEFNDEQEVKLTGLYQYNTSKSKNANTGTTSVWYNPYSFPNYEFPVYSLIATPGPGGNGTLVGAFQAIFTNHRHSPGKIYNDLFVRDNFEDTGIIPSTGLAYKSPDIIPMQDQTLSWETANETYEGPDQGKSIMNNNVNNIYVRAKNLDTASGTGNVSLFYTKASLFVTPNTWTQIKSSETGVPGPLVYEGGITCIPAEGVAISEPPFLLTWLEPDPNTHYCLIAVVNTPLHTVVIPEKFEDNADFTYWVQNNPAVAFRNISYQPNTVSQILRTYDFANHDSTGNYFHFSFVGKNFPVGTSLNVRCMDKNCWINQDFTCPQPQPDPNGIQICGFDQWVPANFQGSILVTITPPSETQFPVGAELHTKYLQYPDLDNDMHLRVASTIRIARATEDGSVQQAAVLFIQLGECMLLITS